MTSSCLVFSGKDASRKAGDAWGWGAQGGMLGNRAGVLVGSRDLMGLLPTQGLGGLGLFSSVRPLEPNLFPSLRKIRSLGQLWQFPENSSNFSRSNSTWVPFQVFWLKTGLGGLC